MNRRLGLAAAAAALLALLAGCAGLRDALDPRPPEVSLAGAQLTGVSFNYAELVVEVAIDNPNAVAIDLAGFDYRLRADGRTVVEGDQDSSLELAAQDRTTISIPLRIAFGNLAGVLGSLAGRDAIDYDVRLGLDFDVPVLGRRHATVETEGTLPVPHRPRLSLRSLELRQLDFEGAELRASVDVANPNPFALRLDRLDYRLEVGGEAWARGGSSAPLRVEPGGRGTLTLSLAVDFEEVGSRAYTLLARGQPLDYRLQATLQASAVEDWPSRLELPWSHSGSFEPR